MDKKITIAILTLNAEERISKILDKIDCNKYKVIILDSCSTDRTVLIAKRYKCDIINIQQKEFNHGHTREFARNLTQSQIIVFFTDDAIPLNDKTVDKLVKPILKGDASVSYSRQIPKKGANILESFPREFNYNQFSHIRSIKDIDKFGVFTFFCSNSSAAWSNNALDKVGGFRSTLTNEDYITTAQLLLKGFKIAYVADSLVSHSHCYSLKQEFQRMFDTGYIRSENKYIQDLVGDANKRGYKYFHELLKKLWKKSPHLIPYAFINTLVKFLGYRIGFRSLNAPYWFKKICSSQKYYWTSKYYSPKS